MAMSRTKRKRTQEAGGQQQAILAVQARLLAPILKAKDLEERLKTILDQVMALLKVEFGAIYLKQAEAVQLVCWHGFSDEFHRQALSFPAHNPPAWLRHFCLAHRRSGQQREIPELAEREGIQAWISLPLNLPPPGEGKPEEWLGTIVLGSRHDEVPSEEDVQTLVAIADYLALVIDHARAYRLAQERLARLQALSEIDKAIIQKRDLREVLQVVLEQVPAELGADAVAISLLDEKQTRTEVFAMRLPNGTIIDQQAFTLTESLLHWFVERQETVIIYDLEQDPRVQMDRERIRHHKLVSYLGRPLVVQGKTTGILHILTTQPKVFRDEDLELLWILAGQAAIAIGNAQAGEALQKSHDLLQTIIESITDPIFVKDREGRFVMINSAAAKLVGKPAAEIIGQDDTYIFSAEIAQQLTEHDRRLMASGQTQVYEENLVLQGTPKLYLSTKGVHRDLQGEIVGLVAVARDITERKQMEETLRRSEEKYRQLFEQDLSGIGFFTPEGKLLDCNPAFARIFDFASIEEARGSNLSDFFPDPTVLTACLQQLRQKKVLERSECYLRRRDGKPLYVIANVIGSFNEQGELTGLTAYLSDQTERKQLEEQFYQAQKMEAIGRLAGGVAHDFNNILTIIEGYSQLLLRQLEASNPLREAVEDIQKAGERASALTRQLLAFSRRQVLQPQVLDLNAVISEMSKMLRRLIGEDLELVTVLAPELGRVKADPGQLEQVIMNLVVNARDAMPAGGKLTIETSNVELSEEYAGRHLNVKPGPYVMLAVSDTGMGMDAETISRIFEPFFTTKEQGKGTGLGLATVYGIIKQSGGDIWVYSEVGQGTTFKIYLPLVTEAAETHNRVNTATPLRGWETILLVEDDEAVRMLVKRVLESYGYQVLVATSISEAIHLGQEYAGPIQLLLTDVVMPEISAPLLAERLAVFRPEMKVLYMSGYTDNVIVHRGVLDPGTALLQKPFSPEALARKVREVLDAPEK
jgi:PAS domain S-box-containing protein